MEMLFLLCVLLTLGGLVIAIISIFEEEPVQAAIGILLLVIGLASSLTVSERIEDPWNCCGNEIHSEYCSECGKARPAECKDWECCDHERDSNVKFCPDCGKSKPASDNTTNNIVVKDNENVEINVNDDVVVVEDKWTCCDKEIDSKFCPDCGKQNNNDTASNTEITKENSNNKGE
jgi:hypothetical protein